ncbi:MAG TPA: Trp biosynthesis-associated membrane protein [Pseudonocardia sp.]|nr:Trp biosynthesis-associated membrane protein [Pseudonocardia sp.]
MTPDRRSLTLACAGLALAAAALWAASALDWYRVTADVPLRGPVDVAVTGAQVQPGLTGVGLAALAAVAALVATGGPVRRTLGLVLAVAGLLLAGSALRAFAGSPFAAGGGGIPEPPAGVPAEALAGAPTETTTGPLLAVLGGLLLLGAGVLVMLREARLPRLGGRYAAPSARPAPADPDRAAWEALDAGRDPTTGPPDPR